MIEFRSLVEISEIAVDATKECYVELKQWLGNKVAQLDEWLCTYGDDTEC